jgi:arginine utilization protein RocB
MQQRNAFTQGLLFNAVQHQAPTKELVDRCIEVAEYAVEKVFGMTVTAKPAQE